MIRFEAEQVIGRSADEVWAYAADVVRHPEWMGVTDARMLDGRSTEVGGRALETVKVGPRTYRMEFEVSAAEPGRRIAWHILSGGPLRGDVTLELQPEPQGGTRATYHGALVMTGIWRLVEPLLAGEVRSGEAAELLRLKAALEGAAPGH